MTAPAGEPATTPAVVLDAGVATDVGLRRLVNEDSAIAAYPIFAVADGMGGHEAGDKASQAVVAALETLVGGVDVDPERLAGVLEAAQAGVEAVAEGTDKGAGSTLTGAAVHRRHGVPHWLVFNVGDSRVYRLREGLFEQLTVDHSIVQQLLDDGSLDPSEAATFKGRNVITRAMGAEDNDADVWFHPVINGERLVLCSDGLSGEVDDAGIAAVLDAHADSTEAAEALVAAALAGGGRDNVTVVVLGVVSGGLESADQWTLPRMVAAEPDDFDGDTLESPNRKARP